jgi:4-amino-4-deoxy-L-arabinose transferase-like glycosyltransferase
MNNVTGAIMIGGLVGVAACLVLYWRDRQRRLEARTIFLSLLIVGLVCRLLFVFFTPVFQAPDEQSHLNYVKYLSEHKAFPVATTRAGDPANEWEYFQPPLYYLLLAPVYQVVGWLLPEPAARVPLLRLCSVLLWLANVGLAMAVLRRLDLKDAAVRSLTLGMVCLLPTYVFVSSAINNDNLLATLGGVLVWLMARQEASWRAAGIMGMVLGLALLTKQSALVFVPGIALLRFLECKRGKLKWGQGLGQLAVTLGIAALMALPWALRNWRVYGTFTPENLSAYLQTRSSMVEGLLSAGHNLVKTFWSVAGISNEVGYPFPLVGMGLMFLWASGYHLALQRPEKSEFLNIKATGDLIAAWTVSVLFALSLVLNFGYQYGMGQGRHLFVLLIPIALLLAAGWRRLLIPKLELHAAAFWILYATGFLIFSLVNFPR